LSRLVEVVFLGSSGGMPTRERGLPSIFIKDWKGFGVLFDVGEGTQYKMIKYGISPSKINLIAITHSHGDHINGLPGLLQTLFMLKRKRPLTILCDRSSAKFIREALEVERIPFTFPLNIIEVKDIGSLDLYRSGGDTLKILWRPSCHSIESYMYRLEWRLRPRIDIKKLKSLNVELSAKEIRELLRKGSIEVRNKVIKLSEVSTFKEGASLVYTGDTAPCKEIVEFAKGARILIHDATFGNELAKEAHERGHSTATDAALIARESGVHLLILTHISARYRGSEALSLLREAQRIYPNTILAWDGMKLTFSL
jgi:ribonuclease Z